MSRLADTQQSTAGVKRRAFKPESPSSIIRLGLIGDNIVDSQSPRLHRLAARLCGLNVQYDLLIPPRAGEEFGAVFARCAEQNFRGVNVTYPYKERVVPMVSIKDPSVRRLGGINTVIFDRGRPLGYNTDYSGFISAYHKVMGASPPGRVCLLGAGGVGKAVAFGLLAVGLEELCIVEQELRKAEALADAMLAVEADLRIRTTSDPVDGSRDAEGLVNCTPVGMVGHEGTPLPRKLMHGASWAFDAVYTPVDTMFLRDASTEGLKILSGYELFFYQGIDAFQHFTGHRPDESALRAALLSSDE